MKKPRVGQRWLLNARIQRRKGIPKYSSGSYQAARIRNEKTMVAKYARIGRVKGIYCQKQPGDTTTENQREAIDQVKLKAARLGATHISAPICTLSEGLDMTNNCFDKIVCSAFALENLSAPHN